MEFKEFLNLLQNIAPNEGSHIVTQTLVINFTTGAILSDSDYCASLAGQTRPTTPTYGTIPSDRFQDAWADINDHQNRLDAALNEVKQHYLPTYLKHLKNNPKPSLNMPYLATVLMFNQPKLKTDIRHERPIDVSHTEMRKPNMLTRSGDQDISHTRRSFSSSF